MLRRLAAIVLLVLAAPLFAWAAAGSATISETTAFPVQKVVWTWTSGTGAEGGTVTSTTTASFTGKLIGFSTDPGSTAPTDNYDVEILDSGSHDALLGAGANRDTANTEHVAEASIGAVAGSRLTLSITNAGDAKVGVVVLWIR